MPALEWMATSPALHGRVLTPVKTKDGEYKAETDADVYVVFLFIKGKVPGIQGMTREQTVELAEILALMHEISGSFPFKTHLLTEDLSLPFCDQLTRFLIKPGANCESLNEIVSPYTDMLVAAIRETVLLRDAACSKRFPLVLCHGDAHGNNVIVSKRLVLADWEDLRLAPAEADLFIYAWHQHGDVLLEAYTNARCGYQINHDLLYFYVLRRRIEDVWVDIQRLTEESPNEAETVKLLEWTRRGIEEVNTLMIEKLSKQ
jgi:Ser/Thr protein kinase RdoA (MazF antagonist)